MELDCITARIAALALIFWGFVSVPIGLVVGAFIHHAQAGAIIEATSDTTEHLC